jgi:hypothetical protein
MFCILLSLALRLTVMYPCLWEQSFETPMSCDVDACRTIQDADPNLSKLFHGVYEMLRIEPVMARLKSFA